MVPIVGYFTAKEFSNGGIVWYYFSAQMIATIYSLYWDYVWDWGLCRDGQILRKQRKFDKKVYYVLMITNFLMRFWWIVPMTKFKFEDHGTFEFLNDFEAVMFTGMLIEAIRRT
jgi:hypothetical protein